MKEKSDPHDKNAALEPFREDNSDTYLTTNQGVRVSDNQNSLKLGARGPTLMEDFILLLLGQAAGGCLASAVPPGLIRLL
jgi:hypothetical protein